MFKVRGIKKKFKNIEVLRGVDFEVKIGEILVVVG